MSFRDWYINNQDEITWFIIGWVSMSCLDNLVRGSYGWAAIDAAIAYLNYRMYNVRL